MTDIYFDKLTSVRVLTKLLFGYNIVADKRLYNIVYV